MSAYSYNHIMSDIMQTTIQIKAQGRRFNSPAIVSAGEIRRKLSTAMASILRGIFSERGTMAAAAIAIGAMAWHIGTITDTLAAQRVVAIDCLCLLPWGIAYIIRSLSSKKGGEK